MDYPESLITRYPEAPRRCIVSLIQRADDRQAGFVFAVSRLDRREGR